MQINKELAQHLEVLNNKIPGMHKTVKILCQTQNDNPEVIL
jgi:hypothetical protein